MAFEHNSRLADSEPGWGGLDKTSLPRIAHADKGVPDKKTTWRFPHHWIKSGGDKDDKGVFTSGTMYLHRGGLNAAWQRANQKGIDTSGGVRAHLEAHRKVLGMTTGFMVQSRPMKSYTVRLETLKGREHIVAPITLLVEGVHTPEVGSTFVDLFFSNSEISKYVDQWNGMPLAVNHPRDAYGNYMSCRSPDVIQNSAVGNVWKSHFNNGLKGEAWIDVGEAERLMPEVLADIRLGRPVEISVGAAFMPVGEPGEWKGERYEAKATSLCADHVAILPDLQGACSVKDGCGIRAAARGHANKQKESKSMEKKQDSGGQNAPCDGCEAIIDALIADSGTAWQEGDRVWMNGLEKGTLERILKTPSHSAALEDKDREKADVPPDKDTKTAVKADSGTGGSDAGGGDPVPQDAVPQPAGDATVAASGGKVSLGLADMPEEVRHFVAAMQERESAEKKDLVARIFANARNKLSITALEGLPSAVLSNMLGMDGAEPVFAGANGNIVPEDGKAPEPLGLPSLAAEAEKDTGGKK